MKSTLFQSVLVHSIDVNKLKKAIDEFLISIFQDAEVLQVQGQPQRRGLDSSAVRMY